MYIYYGFAMVSPIVVAGFIVGCYRCTAATASGTATNLPFRRHSTLMRSGELPFPPSLLPAVLVEYYY